MFERFSEKARRVIFFARYEASQFGSPVIDTEHLLLGILREDRNLLSSLISPDLEDIVKTRISEGCPIRAHIPTSVDLPFSEASKHVMNYAVEEADHSKRNEITHKHILIGLLREEGCFAHTILTDLGITRKAIIRHQESQKTVDSEILGQQATGKAVPNDAFRKAIVDAVDEATLFSLMSARPEHLLLALLRDEHSLAGKILKEAGLSYEEVRKRLE